MASKWGWFYQDGRSIVDPVYVVAGVDGASTYHRRIHGQWSSTHKVEKSSAVQNGRRPCGICYPGGA